MDTETNKMKKSTRAILLIITGVPLLLMLYQMKTSIENGYIFSKEDMEFVGMWSLVLIFFFSHCRGYGLIIEKIYSRNYFHIWRTAFNSGHWYINGNLHIKESVKYFPCNSYCNLSFTKREM